MDWLRIVIAFLQKCDTISYTTVLFLPVAALAPDR